MSDTEFDRNVLDDAARAGWLYYVGGRTQDEIAKTLGISRQRAQRLVARAVADGLIQVRLSHPVADLMELGARLRDKYQLQRVRIAPDLGVDGNLRSVAPFAASVLEGVIASSEPRTIGFGTGRALRASIEAMKPMDGRHHRLVSMIGNIAPDGTASVYDVLMRIADRVGAPFFPLPTPVLAENIAERDAYLNLKAVRNVFRIANEADTIFVGIGQLDETAPLLLDGFMSKAEWQELSSLGVIGEIGGSMYDSNGKYVESKFSDRMTSIRMESSKDRLVVGIAAGSRKINSIRAALKGKLINALVTDEVTARALLDN